MEIMFGGNANEELFEQTFGEKEMILFGEGYGKKKPGKEDESEDRTGEGAGTEERDS